MASLKNFLDRYYNYGGTGGATTLDSLTDVSVNNPVTDQVLKYNGTIWINGTGGGGANFTAGTGVTIANSEISIGQAVATNSNVTFNDLTVSGNLTVSGTTTTVNTETINLADNIIALNSNASGSPTENAGIEVNRGTSAAVQLRWNETSDKWQFTSDGTNYSDLIGADTTQTLTNKTLGATTVSGHLIPSADITYDLGSAANRFRDLYLSGTTINLGNASISAVGSSVALPSGSTIGGAGVQPVNGVFFENSQTVSANYTISNGKSAITVGPVNIQTGVVVTIPTGSKWVVL